MPANGPWSISADWIVTGEAGHVRRGLMRGRGGRIEAVAAVGELAPAKHHRHMAGVVVLPGLVNAHTHLELTQLRGQLPAGRPMTQWLFALLRKRQTPRQQRRAVEAGAAEAIQTGTTALADISHNNRAWEVLADSPLRKVCFAEVTGIGPLAMGATGRLEKRLRAVRPSARLRFGLSPHAPYSTAEDVYRDAVALARRRNWPVCTHLAETESERQFLLRGTGKFFDFLGHVGLIDSSVAVHGCRPVEFARRVGLLDGPCILAHVNYIDDEELNMLAGSGATVVLCPRSNDFFRRTGHRYAEMIRAGINVALGTDSLASNTSLDMLEEMRRLRQDGKVDNRTILRMATLNGAHALGWADKIGSLAPAKQADWIAVDLPAGQVADPLEAVLTTDVKVVQTVIGGRTVFPPPPHAGGSSR